jgi:hypothetical protein
MCQQYIPFFGTFDLETSVPTMKGHRKYRPTRRHACIVSASACSMHSQSYSVFARSSARGALLMRCWCCLSTCLVILLARTFIRSACGPHPQPSPAAAALTLLPPVLLQRRAGRTLSAARTLSTISGPTSSAAPCATPQCMHTSAAPPLVVMTSSPSRTRFFFCSRGACLGRAIRGTIRAFSFARRRWPRVRTCSAATRTRHSVRCVSSATTYRVPVGARPHTAAHHWFPAICCANATHCASSL